MIKRDVERDLVDVDWTDDCRVKLWVRNGRVKLTLTEARALRTDLDEAIGEASRAADDLLGREVEPASFDVATLSPDCRDGNKHRACIGTAWDALADELTNCTCECHAEAVAA